MSDSPLLTRAEAAAYLRVSLRTLDRLDVPRIKYGHRTMRYERAALDAWITAHKEAA